MLNVNSYNVKYRFFVYVAHKLIPFHKTRRGHPRRGRTSPYASGPRMGWGDGRSAAPFMQGSSIDRNKLVTEFSRHEFKRLDVPCGFEDCHERLCAEFCTFAIGVALPEQSRVGFSNGGCYCFCRHIAINDKSVDGFKKFAHDFSCSFLY
nr:MAG TPA: hypothetical protein [Caudoviricetes sp.]